jgi:outer membrane protein assembly factor BamB
MANTLSLHDALPILPGVGSPVVWSNRVFVTGADAQTREVFCFDADTGGVVWKNAPDKYLATYSSPSISGRYLVVGEGLHMTREARVVCLDRERNGAVVWTYTTKSHVESSPVIAGGRIFVVDRRKSVVALQGTEK